jgi:hypothetical protein
MVFGLATVVGACAAHPPAPAPPPAAVAAPPRAGAAPDPVAGLAGQILTTRHQIGRDTETLANFVAEARATQTERILRNPAVDGADEAWNLYFAAFLREGGWTKGEVHVQFVDLTGGKRETVGDASWSIGSQRAGGGIFQGSVQLLEPWFVGDRRYEMTIEVDRVAKASTTFWLLNERGAPARSDGDAAAGPTPARQSPDIVSGSPRGDGPEMLERARRVPGSVACAPVNLPDIPQPPADGPRSSPSVRLRSPDKETIRQVIRRHIPAVRECYEGVLRDLPTLQGRLMSRFVIGPEGGVRGSCEVESDLKNATLESCILDEVLTIKFPESIDKHWIVVDYPFVLVPVHDDDAPPSAAKSRTRKK